MRTNVPFYPKICYNISVEGRKQGVILMKNALTLLFYDIGISRKTLDWLYHNADQETYRQLLYENLDLAILSDKDRDLLRDSKRVADSYKRVKKILRDHQHYGIKCVSQYDAHYPQQLRNIKKPPLFLFYKGDLSLLNQPALTAVVGTRQPSNDTIENIHHLIKQLTTREVTTISGLALGTDTEAHKATIANSGKTIAVLPSSLTGIYPRSNAYLANKIANSGGLTITPFYRPEIHKYQFIERNRIVAALSRLVIIAECKEKSGTMHTARFAHDFNRQLFCFNNQSSGIRKIKNEYGARTYYGLQSQKV